MRVKDVNDMSTRTDEPAVSLDALFSPGTVAVIGASDDPSRIGGRVLVRLTEHFAGTIYPVNAHRDSVQGLRSYRSPEDLPTRPDLAIIAVPAARVLPAIESLSAKGCRAAIVLTSGFAELGPEGKEVQDRLGAIARESGMRIVGPNCVGTISMPHRMLATFADLQMRPVGERHGPGVAVVSQSGALGATFFQAADALGLNVTYVCTTGNEADVSAAEAVAALVERPDVHTVMVFLEALRDPDILLAAGRRALELGKPIVAMKVGRSDAGARAAASHSGSLAAPDRLAQALFDSAGILRADSPQELLAMTSAMAAQRFPAGDRVAVMTLSGGVGIMMADELDAQGLSLPPTSAATRSVLEGLMPAYGSPVNPIDYTANAVNDPAGFADILEAVVMDDDFDMVCINGLSMATFEESVAAIAAVRNRSSKPIIVSMSGVGPETFNALGIPCISDTVQAAKALGSLRRYALARTRARPTAPLLSAGASAGGDSRILSGDETRTLLSDAGVPLVPERAAAGADAAADAAAVIGFPVAVKLDQSVTPHKTEVGGIELGLTSADDVRGAVERMQASLHLTDAPPVIVQRMVGRGIELSVGAVRDGELGPAVMVGLGGVMVEILDEIALALVPVDEDDARALVQSLCDGRLVSSGRGLDEAAARQVAEVVIAVSRLMEEASHVVEVDINPLILDGGQLIAVDGLVRVESSA